MTRTLWQKQNKNKQIKWLAPGILIVQVYKNSPHTWGLLARPFLANYINFLNVLEYVRINLREPLCNLIFFLHHLLHLKTQSLYHSVNSLVLTPYWAIVFLTPFWYTLEFVSSLLSLTLDYIIPMQVAAILQVFSSLYCFLEVRCTNISIYTKDFILST